MKYYNGKNKTHNFFEGWYFKHQQKGYTISAIIGYSIDEKGVKLPFIQIIDNTFSQVFYFPNEKIYIQNSSLKITLGKNTFSKYGCTLDIDLDGTCIKGDFTYSNFSKLGSNIMGPFSLLSFMECNHGIISMYHTVKGTITINNKTKEFSNAKGYIEKDFGTSFPTQYLWSHCNDFGETQNSIMIAIATIPFKIFSFTGVICAIMYHGKEYRFATYKGCKINYYNSEKISLSQGKYDLEVSFTPKQSNNLIAPKIGKMNIPIKESVNTFAIYKLYYKKHLVFSLSSDNSAYEFVT